MKLKYVFACLLFSAIASAEGPSFSCENVRDGSMEALICQDEELSRQDRIMAKVYAKAKENVTEEMLSELKGMQRGWIKGRDECWKEEDKKACIKEAYDRRRVTLQAKYRLVDASFALHFSCNANPKNELVVTYFNTEPATLIAERGDTSHLMIQGEQGIYKGGNSQITKTDAGLDVVWGYYNPEELKCEQLK